MLADAVFEHYFVETPIVQPRNLVQSTLQILIVITSALENTAEKITCGDH